MHISDMKSISIHIYFHFTLKPFLFFSQSKLLPLADTPDKQADLLIEVLRLLKPMHELALYNEVFLTCYPLLSSTLALCGSTEEIKARIQTEIEQLVDCEGKTLLAHKLSSVEEIQEEIA